MLPSTRPRRWLEQLLHTHDTPERTATAFALGVFWGFSPFFGLHTVLALAVAIPLRLNRVAVILGVYSNLPWVIAPYYVLATILGAYLLRVDVPAGLLDRVRDAATSGSWTQLRQQASALSPLVWAYLVGSTIGAALLAAAAYPLSLATITAHRRRLQRASQPHDRA